VTVGAGLRYGQVVDVLSGAGLALHNLASLPHISVAGAVATATHGSGPANGNLATAVAALELVTSGGEVVRVARGDAGFDGTVVGLGALGVVTRVTLDVEPAYEVGQRVFEGLPWATLYDRFDEVTSAGYSVSLFTLLGEDVDMVWVKSRTDRGEAPAGDLFGAREAPAERHPIPGLDPTPTTGQLGRPGRWSDRLPHFRMGFTPSAGEELQSEYFISRARLGEALAAVREIGHVVEPELLVTEVRTIAADDLWLSGAYGGDAAALHFTWQRHPEQVDAVLDRLEEVLLPLGARPHWGKVFRAGADVVTPRYPRFADFCGLAERFDPEGRFRNAWTERKLGLA
jgi:xylitol oxidase